MPLATRSVNTYLDVANRYGLKITFHIEPIYKTAEQFKGEDYSDFNCPLAPEWQMIYEEKVLEILKKL